MASGGRSVVESYVDAIVRMDWDAASRFLSDDYVEDYPQSGERVEGPERFRAIFRNFPGRVDGAEVAQERVDVVGGDDRWVMTPTFMPLRVEGTGDAYTTLIDATYPDGTRWFIVSLVTLREGRITRARTFWAPDFDPAEWRAPFVRIVKDRSESVRP